MRSIPGWVVGALGVTAIVSAFHVGGRVGAMTPAAPAPPMASTAAQATPVVTAPLADVAVECEPGQRAVVKMATAAGTSPSVACVSEPRPVATAARTSYASAEVVTPVAYANERAATARRASIVDPVEVYQPRSVPVSAPTRSEIEPRRSVKKSVAIIAGSTAAGAVVGGLAKGKKGAVIGGIVGGGAATVWDQVTRRRVDW